LNSSQFKEIKYSHLAEQLGYETAEFFLDWVQGKQEPTFSELRKIAQFLGVNQDWLLHGDGYPTSHTFFLRYLEILKLIFQNCFKRKEYLTMKFL